MAKKKVAKKAKKATKKTAGKKTVKKTTKKPTQKAAKKTVKKGTMKKAATRVVKAVKKTVKAVARKVTKTVARKPAAAKRAPAPLAPAALVAMPGPAEPLIPALATGAVEPAVSAPMPSVGDLAPDFALQDETGQTHRLGDYRGQTVVLYFYPKDDTPGCTREACGFRDMLGHYTDRNAVVLGMSPDDVASHQRFVQKYSLTFPLLADPDHKIAEQYGVWVEKNKYGRTYWGIARTTFVIDADGRIKQIFKNVQVDGHNEAVLATL